MLKLFKSCSVLSAPDIRHHVQHDPDWSCEFLRGSVLRVAMHRRMRAMTLVYSIQHGYCGLGLLVHNFKYD